MTVFTMDSGKSVILMEEAGLSFQIARFSSEYLWMVIVIAIDPLWYLKMDPIIREV